MENVNTGRKVAVAVIVILLLMEIITTIMTSTLHFVNGNLEYASYNILQGIFRLILSCIILYFFYKGHRWAKWLLIFLMLLAGIAALISLFVSLNIIMMIMGVIYLSVGMVLLFSKSLKEFLLCKRNETKK